MAVHPYDPTTQQRHTAAHVAAGSRCRTLFSYKQGIFVALQPEGLVNLGPVWLYLDIISGCMEQTQSIDPSKHGFLY